jgi:hypothetical protein
MNGIDIFKIGPWATYTGMISELSKEERDSCDQDKFVLNMKSI